MRVYAASCSRSNAAMPAADSVQFSAKATVASAEFYTQSVSPLQGVMAAAFLSEGYTPAEADSLGLIAGDGLATRGAAIVADEVTKAIKDSTAQGGPTPHYDRRYYATDHLGTIRAVFDVNGNVLEARDYYPLGLQIPDRVFASGSLTSEGFTGHELDPETGDYYAGARYYLPELGRWTAVDPHAERYSDQSPFGYVYNNPLSYMDLLGLDPCGEMYPDDEGAPVGECLDEGEAVVEAQRNTLGDGAGDVAFFPFATALRIADIALGLSDAVEAVDNFDDYARNFSQSQRDGDVSQALCDGKDLLNAYGDMAGFVENASSVGAVLSSETVVGPVIFAAAAQLANAASVFFDVGGVIVDGVQTVRGERSIANTAFNAGFMTVSAAPGVRLNSTARTWGLRGGRFLFSAFGEDLANSVIDDPCLRR